MVPIQVIIFQLLNNKTSRFQVFELNLHFESVLFIEQLLFASIFNVSGKFYSKVLGTFFHNDILIKVPCLIENIITTN